MPKREIHEFEDALLDVVAFLNSISGRGVIIGGLAVAALARGRTTLDIDATVFAEHETVEEVLVLAAARNIQPRIEDAASFARKNRVLLLRHNPTAIDVDISGFPPI